MRRASAMLVVLSGLVGATARADIYECVDASGARHYTNVRPSGRSCRLMVRASAASRRAARPTARTAGSPARADRYRDLIREAASLYQLPEPFLRAIMRVESGYSSTVVSHTGAMGLMQLMPRTAAAMGVSNPYDPRQNVLGGARYLRILANRYNGDLVLTIAAYNAGEGAVDRYGGVPPYAETRRYVRRVLHHYYAFRDEAPRQM